VCAFVRTHARVCACLCDRVREGGSKCVKECIYPFVSMCVRETKRLCGRVCVRERWCVCLHVCTYVQCKYICISIHIHKYTYIHILYIYTSHTYDSVMFKTNTPRLRHVTYCYAPRAAVVSRLGDTHKSHLSHLLDHFRWEFVCLIPFTSVRCQFRIGKRTAHFPKHLVLVTVCGGGGEGDIEKANLRRAGECMNSRKHTHGHAYTDTHIHRPKNNDCGIRTHC